MDQDTGRQGTADPADDPNGRLRNQIETPAREQNTRQLGDQVRPETQLREDDGNRTLALPRTDPGQTMLAVDDDLNATPVRSTFKHSDRENGHRPMHELNEPIAITRRVSTVPDHLGDNTAQHHLSPDHVIQSGASDMYHPEGRKQGRDADGRDMVRERAEEPRVDAPKDHSSTLDNPFAGPQAA